MRSLARCPSRRSGGFTLLEVFIATALLGFFMVIYLDSLTRSPDRANRAKLASVATMLARAKLIDVEAELFKDRWDEFDDEECGDFLDEEFGEMARYKWCVTIEKIELPDSVDIQSVVGRMLGGQGEDGEEGDGEASGASTSPMSNLLGMWMGNMGGMAGGAGGSGGSTADGGLSAIGSLLGSFIAPFRSVVEQAIRRITLRVFWKYRGKEEHVTLLYYVARPDLVDQAIIGGFLGQGIPGAGTTQPGATQPGGAGSGTRVVR